MAAFRLFAPLALIAAAPAGPPITVPVATDAQEAITARLVETGDSVRFEISGPSFVSPAVAIDVQRNGKVDADTDFLVSTEPGGAPCLSRMISKDEMTPCGPLGTTAQYVRQQARDGMTTTIVLPKKAVSADGSGFGFAITLWNEKGGYSTGLASGEYQFGGTLRILQAGRDFVGNAVGAPGAIAPAVHQYQGCLHARIQPLEALDQSKLAALRAVKGQCAATRQAALEEGVAALVRGGSDREQAERTTRALLDEVDTGPDGMIETLEPHSGK